MSTLRILALAARQPSRLPPPSRLIPVQSRHLETRRTFSASPSAKFPIGVDPKTTGGVPWSIGELNHVAIAVPDIDKATSFYRDVLKAKVSEKVALPDHGVYTVFINLGNTKIELLHPYGPKSPIANFLAKKPDGGIHHICVEVDDIKAAMADLKAKKIRALDPEPKIGAHGKPVVFLHPKDCGGVLVELEQK
ncbi:dl-methylmalonyl-CoA racemase [Fimicolochytrium jonesii]|uniref:dl-methylmalonyl-CoA racemase n=1 Tax=Fimicolochytrium jonesii TaxID=1396493 RepID=UPI0022FE6B7A|nr:dl-methylmalonyl-CoA racemase [Fimicolochytrium jonesii]KAI8816479.1 dl-methylmalonyl-CoA racemase [Fimicolochytrium jonesii]